jgi:lysophospholipase L1-like esterase
VVAVTLAVLATSRTVLPANADSAGPSYVALGDSYTAGPGVQPVDPSATFACLRSLANYPHRSARALGLSLTDRSCSGATTADMTAAQLNDQPPQFASLSRSTDVVTIGIGGNDNQLFISAIAACSVSDVLDVLDAGAPCRSLFGSFFADEVDRDGATIAQALDAIHTLASGAQVFVVGYPDILPQRGRCYPQLPLTTGDIMYLNQLELHLDAMLEAEAAAHSAIYVDTFTPSIGHDACQSEATRWVEPLVPGTTEAVPNHPNARGEAADARALVAALRSAGL